MFAKQSIAVLTRDLSYSALLPPQLTHQDKHWHTICLPMENDGIFEMLQQTADVKVKENQQVEGKKKQEQETKTKCAKCLQNEKQKCRAEENFHVW